MERLGLTTETRDVKRQFLDLPDAFISIFGRIYLGDCDLNSSPITILTSV
jgi:hypothetical protein